MWESDREPRITNDQAEVDVTIIFTAIIDQTDDTSRHSGVHQRVENARCDALQEVIENLCTGNSLAAAKEDAPAAGRSSIPPDQSSTLNPPGRFAERPPRTGGLHAPRDLGASAEAGHARPTHPADPPIEVVRDDSDVLDTRNREGDTEPQDLRVDTSVTHSGRRNVHSPTRCVGSTFLQSPSRRARRQPEVLQVAPLRCLPDQRPQRNGYPCIPHISSRWPPKP